MEYGSRAAQLVYGSILALVGAALLLGHYVVGDHAPNELELWGGFGALGLAGAFLAPVRWQQVVDTTRSAVPFIPDDEEEPDA